MITLPDKYAGRTIFSASESAEILGMPYATFKYNVYTKKTITGKKVGNKTCYTLEQLSDFSERGYTDIEFDDTGMFTAESAAKYLDIPESTLSYYTHRPRNVGVIKREVVGRRGGKRGGGVLIYRKEDLDEFCAKVLGGKIK